MSFAKGNELDVVDWVPSRETGRKAAPRKKKAVMFMFEVLLFRVCPVRVTHRVTPPGAA